MFPLFSKGLQISRCLSMTRICCLRNRGQSLLLELVRSGETWKGAENQGLFSSEGHFIKPATPRNWIRYQIFCEGSTVWEVSQKKIIPEGRKRPEVPELLRSWVGRGGPHWPGDDRRMLRAWDDKRKSSKRNHDYPQPFIWVKYMLWNLSIVKRDEQDYACMIISWLQF